ncbi:MAG: YajQ family cyclic di-GMP-binding protein [Rickettsiales bacterium]|nr:YajQ family cyclic di-GMP-binding protein [Rickettsiales bacterium]
MPSFDVVSKIDLQEVDNATNTVLREIGNRYDFKSVKWSLELDKKEKTITITAESDYCLEQIQTSLKGAFVKRKLDPIALDFQKTEKATGNSLRQVVKIKEGIDQENAKQITKYFKQSKLKVQASIQGDEVRVSGKSRDDLQIAIQEIKGLNLTVPLQFINFRD